MGIEAGVSWSYESRGMKGEASAKSEWMPTEVERAFFERASGRDKEFYCSAVYVVSG